MNKIYNKVIDNCKYIEQYYEKLVELTKNHNFVGSTNEWIIDNFYLVVEQRNVIKKFAKNRNNKEIIASTEDMYKILLDIFLKHNFNVDKNILMKELNSYQTKNDFCFSYNAISVIPIYISIILIEELYGLCKKREEKLDDLRKVNEVISKIDEARLENPDVNLNEFVKIDKYIIDHPYYLYNLNANLKEFGESSNDIFEKLSKYLEENNVDLKEVINDEHLSSINDNLLVSNLFNNLRTVSKLKYDELCNRISKAEKTLLTDSVYKNMTQESKNLYRRQIVKNAKKIEIEYDSNSDKTDKYDRLLVWVFVDGKKCTVTSEEDIYCFQIPSADNRQDILILARDAAGNQTRHVINGVLVTTNRWIRWYHNKGWFAASIVGGFLAVFTGCIGVFWMKRKRQ